MNLISCDDCGIVLDIHKLEFPDDYLDEDYLPIPELTAWSSDKGRHVPFVECPVCKAPILEP